MSYISPVKLKLFNAYCSPLYTPHLWWNYKKMSVSKLQITFHNILKRNIGLSKYDSTSATCAFTCNASYPDIFITVIVTLHTPYIHDHVRFFILQVPNLGITEIPEHMMSSICWVQITIYSGSSHLSSYKKSPSFLY